MLTIETTAEIPIAIPSSAKSVRTFLRRRFFSASTA
jgi:hypothetical protein